MAGEMTGIREGRMAGRDFREREGRMAGEFYREREGLMAGERQGKGGQDGGIDTFEREGRIFYGADLEG